MYFGVAALSLMSSTIPANAVTTQTLSVANWADYIDPDLNVEFERQTGAKINYQTYASEGELRSLVDEGWLDVVVADSMNLELMISKGMLLNFNAKSTSAYQDTQAIVKARLLSKDITGGYAVPYLWGRVGIAVHKPLAEAALGTDIPHSWDLLFDVTMLEKLSSCGTSILNSYPDVFALLLNYRGREISNVSGRKVNEFITSIGPLSTSLTKVSRGDYLKDLPAGQACAVMAWEGDGRKLARENSEIDFFLPKEGVSIYVDSFSIPKKSKNAELAQQYISFMSDPANAKRNAAFTSFNSPSNTVLKQLGNEPKTAINVSEVASFLPPRLTPELDASLARGWDKFMAKVASKP